MLVSVIIPYQVDRGYLQHAIDSVHKQSYKNYELILSQGDAPVGVNLNNGIKKAKGDYITYLCDDDMLTVDSLKHSVAKFGDADFIHGRAINFWNDGKKQVQEPTIKQPTLKQMINKNVIHGGTVMYRASIFEEFIFDEELTSAEEYDFHLKLLKGGKKIGYVNEVLYLYRRWEMQKSLGNTSDAYQQNRLDIRNEIKTRYK